MAAAGGRSISIAGGASCARQAIAAGVVDEIDLQVNPVILGLGERLFDGLEAGSPPWNSTGCWKARALFTCATALFDELGRPTG